MATINFVLPEDRLFHRAVGSSNIAPDVDDFTSDENGVEMFAHSPGSVDDLQLLELRYPPGTKVSSHAHTNDEIMVVTEGEVHFGARVCRPGASVRIPRWTLYSLTAGPEGATILNFRGRGGAQYIPAKDFHARRAIEFETAT